MKAFTLIELLIVLIIVIIFCSIVVTSFNDSNQCRKYEDSLQSEIPAKCLKYFTGYSHHY